jgi:hypothetical protein
MKGVPFGYQAMFQVLVLLAAARMALTRENEPLERDIP